MSEDNRYAPPRAPVGDTPENDGELATRGARFAGALIDGLAQGVVVLPYLLTTDYWDRARTGQVGTSDILGMVLVGLIVFLVLNGYLLHKYGQTIGKRVMGTRIVSATDGEIVQLGKVFGLRYAPFQLAAAIPVIGNFIGVVDVLFIFREDRRCLHDLLAGTKVIKAR